MPHQIDFGKAGLLLVPVGKSANRNCSRQSHRCLCLSRPWLDLEAKLRATALKIGQAVDYICLFKNLDNLERDRSSESFDAYGRH